MPKKNSEGENEPCCKLLLNIKAQLKVHQLKAQSDDSDATVACHQL
jgi:hypothetical protein